MMIQQALQAAWQHRQSGRLQQAIATCAEVFKDHPDNPDAMYLMGMLLAESGRAGDAIELMRRALAFASRSEAELAQGYNNLAAILFTQGRLEEAADSARKAVELAPGFADAHNNLGNILRMQGHSADALK